MSRQVSLQALQAMFAAETGEVPLICLTISHPSMEVPIRVVNNTEDIVRQAGRYIGYPFEIDLPADQEDQIPQVKLVIDNIDRSITDALDQLDSAPKITLEAILASAPDTVEVGPVEFSMLSDDVNSITVTGTLGFEDDLLNGAFPAATFTPTNSPGLFI